MAPPRRRRKPPENPFTQFVLALKKPIQTIKIARLFGLDIPKLEALAQGEGSDRDSKAAKADLGVLQEIKLHLETRRGGSIKWRNNEFVVALKLIPSRILTVEQQRFD